jgi:hypothetical protein
MRRIALAVLLLSVASPVFADDQPSVQLDSIRIEPRNPGGKIDMSKELANGWLPTFTFAVNGPVESGSRITIETKYPGKPGSLTIDCGGQEIAAGASVKIDECTTNGETDMKNTTLYNGPVDFTIKVKNELAGKTQTLFTGKFKVVKYFVPKDNEPQWYIEGDWRYPFAYVGYNSVSREGYLCVTTSTRGDPASIEAHLYYKGKDIAKSSSPGNEGVDYHAAAYKWFTSELCFQGVYNKITNEDDAYDPKFEVSKNPGEYEAKMLFAGHLARSIKFTVNADGTIADPLGSKAKVHSGKVVVPQKVLSPAEPWDKAQWKTFAFYGNPIPGFSAEP